MNLVSREFHRQPGPAYVLNRADGNPEWYLLLEILRVDKPVGPFDAKKPVNVAVSRLVKVFGRPHWELAGKTYLFKVRAVHYDSGPIRYDAEAEEAGEPGQK